MENKIKIPLYLSLALLFVLAAGAVKSLFTNTPVLTNIERITQIRDDSISYWKDKFGREHAEKQMAVASYQEIKIVYGPLMDSVLSALKIQGKQLEQLTVIGMTSSNRVNLKVDTVYVDSAAQYRFAYKDRWIDINGMLGNNSYLEYTSFDSLIISGYTKRRGFLGLGRKETYIDAYSINPHSKMSGLQGIQISKERPKRFGIGPYVGYGYAGGRWLPMVGVGLNYSLIKF
ncbi:MAG: DUF6549 family protein [Taibaiella sp.]|jgi:hypothetical protein